MYNKQIKIGIATLLFAFAVYQFYSGNIGNGILLVLLTAIPIFLIFKNENLLLAFWFMRKQKIAKVEKALSRIQYPQKLLPSQEAYYNFMLGLVETQSRSLAKSEKYFRRALSLGLKMSHNQALTKLNLAMICISKRPIRKREATTLLNEAKKLDKYGMLKEQIAMVKDGMKKV